MSTPPDDHAPPTPAITTEPDPRARRRQALMEAALRKLGPTEPVPAEERGDLLDNVRG